ncbi:MAG: hypothetical protein EOP84_03735 [Verrucomicrobiaceae bacterium]|nr:MAG: hypothetical protein EOP84_03735 [Verrucomicrobiaceae bacterium]
MWLEFLLLSPFFWVPLLLAFLFIEAALVENENATFATVILFAALVLLQIGTSVEPFTWVIHNPAYFIIGALAYVVLGMAWARFKWWTFVADKMNALGEALTERRSRYATYLSDPTHRDQYAKRAKDEAMDIALKGYGGSNVTLPLQVKRFKGRILAWMIYFPVSVLHFVFFDSVVKIYNWAYTLMAASFQRHADKSYAEHQAKFGQD